MKTYSARPYSAIPFILVVAIMASLFISLILNLKQDNANESEQLQAQNNGHWCKVEKKSEKFWKGLSSSAGRSGFASLGMAP